CPDDELGGSELGGVGAAPGARKDRRVVGGHTDRAQSLLGVWGQPEALENFRRQRLASRAWRGVGGWRCAAEHAAAGPRAGGPGADSRTDASEQRGRLAVSSHHAAHPRRACNLPPSRADPGASGHSSNRTQDWTKDWAQRLGPKTGPKDWAQRLGQDLPAT